MLLRKGSDEQVSGLPAVEVLLATYNGARFLREQLDSLFAQDYENLRVLARDDGSRDETLQILSEYAQRFPDRFRLMPASVATGSAKKNFLLLMQASDADYVCFCDQDDVWLPDKVSASQRAMNALETRWGVDTPLLVFSDLRVVDDQLETLYPSFWAHMKVTPKNIGRLATVLVQSVLTGCTAMVNRKMLVLARSMPEEAFMHDRWIALLTASMGKAEILQSPTVLYRQHAENVLGTGQNSAAHDEEQKTRSLLERLRAPRLSAGYLTYWQMSQREGAALIQAHGSGLPVRVVRILEAFIRCQTSRSRLVRVATFLRYGFFYPGFRANAAIAIYLWRGSAGSHGPPSVSC